MSTECCCDHCHNRLRFLTSIGGPDTPDCPKVASKWDNCMQIISGRDKMFAFKVNPDTKVMNIASKCCKTFLLGRQPEYDASCVTVQAEHAIYCNLEEGSIEPHARFFTNQWSRERLSKYKPMVGIWVNEAGSITGENGWEEIFKNQVENMRKAIPDDAVGISFEELWNELSKEGVVIASEENKKS